MPRYGKAALVILVCAQILLFLRLEPVYSNFYLFAWWPAVIIMDSLVRRKKGVSLILDHPREFVTMSIASVYFWLIFEVINFRIGNWYYSIAHPQPVLFEWITGALCFATVLPGIFLSTELFRLYTRLSNTTGRKFPLSGTLFTALFVTGICFLALPLIWPKYFFPLVWGSFIFFLAPLNALFSRFSLLREMSRGRYGTFICLLCGGLLCGLLWEFWNFWAPAKWIYTVPFVGENKLFEMPLLGFLGFPPFAVECYVMYNTLSAFRAGRTWEAPAPLAGRKSLFEKYSLLRMLLPPLLFFLWAAVFSLMDFYTVRW